MTQNTVVGRLINRKLFCLSLRLMLILMLNYIAKKYHSFALKTIPKSIHNIILGLIFKYQLTFPSALKLMCPLQLLQLGFTAFFLYYFFQ